MSRPLLEVDELQTSFFLRDGRVHAVDGVSIGVEARRTLGIVGESGCGKSVTALSIMGVLPRTARIVGGSIRLDGTELTSLGKRRLEDLRGRDLAMIFQDPMTSLNPTVTIGAQLVEPLQRHLGLSGSAARRRAVELLEEVQIPRAGARLDDYPHRYSGGMCQRVMIAMAIACRPKLLIADEPTTALDVTVQAGVLDLLHELQQEHGMALVLITHDMGVIAEMADEVVVMYAGQVVEQAPTTALFDHPEHPYTEALLGALPQLERGGRTAPAPPGDPRPAAEPARSPRLVSLRKPVPARLARRRLRRDDAGAARSSAKLTGYGRRTPAASGCAGRRSCERGDGMSDDVLLAVSGLCKHFGTRRGILGRARRAGTRRRRRQLRDPAGRDARSRRRVRQRQVDDGLRDPPADAADERIDPLRGPRARRAERERAPPDPPADADHLPGPVLVARPRG